MNMLTQTTDMHDSIQVLPEDAADVEIVPSPQRILFIAGWGRSGSTLFANVLGTSKNATNLGEFRYLWARGLHGTRCGCGEPVTECGFWTSVMEKSAWDSLNTSTFDLERFDRAVGATAIFRQLGALVLRRIEAYKSANQADIEQIASILHSVPQGEHPQPVLIDTSKSIPFLVNLAGDERFEIEVLHLTRDPRAVAYSWSRLTDTEDADGVTFPRFGPVRASIYWSIFNIAPVLFEKIVPGVRRHQLAYEDFVAAPRTTIRAICYRYDLDFEPTRWLDGHTVDVDLANDPQHTISGNPSRFRTGPTAIRQDERWKKNMRTIDRLLVSALTAPARRLLTFVNNRTRVRAEAQR